MLYYSFCMSTQNAYGDGEFKLYEDPILVLQSHIFMCNKFTSPEAFVKFVISFFLDSFRNTNLIILRNAGNKS